MKKVLLLLLTFVGMVSTASAAEDLYLQSNVSNWLNQPSWKMTGSWDGGQDVYSIEIPAASITTSDFEFKLYRTNESDVLGAYSGADDYSFGFSDGQSETYNADGGSSFVGSEKKFVISHSTIKASKYRISIYVKYPDGENWKYYIKVEIVDMPVTIATEGKGTFCCDRALNFSGTGIKAYLITGVASSGVLATSDPLTYVPANTPLYVVGSTANIPVVTTEAASEVIVSENKLKQGAGVAVPETESTNINFILTNKTTTNPSAPLKFYRANDNVVPSNKAYLQLPSEIVLAREFVWFDDEATAVNVVKQEQKFDGKVFNLAGQRIANPIKGLFIVNGKKVIK